MTVTHVYIYICKYKRFFPMAKLKNENKNYLQ